MSGAMALGTQASPAHSPGWARGLGALLALLILLILLLVKRRRDKKKKQKTEEPKTNEK